LQIILNCSKLFLKEVLHICEGPHPNPLLKNLPAGRQEGEGGNVKMFRPEKSSLTY
jgi:hypothetical protein